MILDSIFWQQTLPTLVLTREEGWAMLMEAAKQGAQQVKQSFFTRLPNSSQQGIHLLLDQMNRHAMPWLDKLGQQLLQNSHVPLVHFLTLTCREREIFRSSWGMRTVITYLAAQSVDMMEAHLIQTEPALMTHLASYVTRMNVNLSKDIWNHLVFPVQQRFWDDGLSPVTIQFINQFTRDGLLKFIGIMGEVQDNEPVQMFYHCLMTTYDQYNKKTLLHDILEDNNQEFIEDEPNIQLLIKNIDRLYFYDDNKKDMLFDILHAKSLYCLTKENLLRYSSSSPIAFLRGQWSSFSSRRFEDIFVDRIKIKVVRLHLDHFTRDYAANESHPGLIESLRAMSLEEFIKYISIVGLVMPPESKQRQCLIKNYMNAHRHQYVASEVITQFSQNKIELTDEDKSCIDSAGKVASNQVERRSMFSIITAYRLNLFTARDNRPLSTTQEKELLLTEYSPRVTKNGYGAVSSEGP